MPDNNRPNVNVGLLAKIDNVRALRTFLTRFYPYDADEYKSNFNHVVDFHQIEITPEQRAIVLRAIDYVATGQHLAGNQQRYGGNKSLRRKATRKATRKQRTGHKRKSANRQRTFRMMRR